MPPPRLHPDLSLSILPDALVTLENGPHLPCSPHPTCLGGAHRQTSLLELQGQKGGAKPPQNKYTPALGGDEPMLAPPAPLCSCGGWV